MKEKLVPSKWLMEKGHRLDCAPYVSGAIEARVLLEALDVPRRQLPELTLGGESGIFHAGRESRNYVDDPSQGIPFLSSSDVLLADLSFAPRISKKQAAATPQFILHPGWTLITRSGTIGRMVYCRADMDGLACSEHILRVVPDPEKIQPGYLFSFLSSRFGVPLVVGGTYGSIIRAIEPQHLAGVPVPLAPDAVQHRVHALIESAASARTTATQLLREAVLETEEAWGLPPDWSAANLVRPAPDIVIRKASELNARFDAFYHSTGATSADAAIESIGGRIAIHPLGAVVTRVFETPRFGRVSVEDAKYGVPFMSISDLARFDPVSDALVSRKQVAAMEATVGAGWLILPRVGQLQGLFGHVVCIAPHLDDVAVSDNNIRIVPRTQDDSGYLFAALSTQLSYWQIVRRACGTSIPYLDAARVRAVPVPWPESDVRTRIAATVQKALDLRSRAVRDEREAVGIVEAWIVHKGAN